MQACYVDVKHFNSVTLFTQLLHEDEAQTALFKEPARTAL